MNLSEKLITIADNRKKLYESGKNSMVDPEKIIFKTESGRLFSMNDVSEIAHDVNIKTENGANVTVCARNLFREDLMEGTTSVNGITCEYEGDGIFHIYGSYENAATTHKDFYIHAKTLNIPIDVNSSYSVYSKIIEGDTSNNTYSYLLTSNGTQTKNWICATVKPSTEVGSTVVTSGKGGLYQTDAKRLERFHFYIRVEANSTLNVNIRIQVWLSKGSLPDYEKYIGTTYTADADGNVYGVKSLSPYMNIYTSSDEDMVVSYHKSYGMQTERERFWETFQNKGTRNQYPYAFYGSWWTDNIYNPIYNIVHSDGVSVFQNSSITDTKVTIDLSNFSGSMTAMFSGCRALKKIRKLIVHEALGYERCFVNADKLTDVEFEGVIGKSISFAQSPLGIESLRNIILHLKDYSGGSTETHILTLKDGCKTLLEENGNTSPNGNLWTEYVSDLGWTLA